MYDQKFANYSQIERLQLLKDNCDEMETGTCIRTLTEDEILLKKEELSKNFIEFNKIRNEAKQVANEFKEQLKPIGMALAETSDAIRTKIEEKEGTLFIFKDTEKKQAFSYDEDGNLVQQRRLRADELQIQKLEFSKKVVGE